LWLDWLKRDVFPVFVAESVIMAGNTVLGSRVKATKAFTHRHLLTGIDGNHSAVQRLPTCLAQARRKRGS
jgi:hypothetical protein